MKFLNECYSNADVANLLAWGIEGTHYKIGDDGLATYADGVGRIQLRMEPLHGMDDAEPVPDPCMGRK